MAKSVGQFLTQLQQLFGAPGANSSDGDLLRRYAVDQDQTAFAALVERYAALVYGVCRRVLADEHDAEDAFQATFLILMRKARTLDGRGSIAGWLHMVAQRTALKARTRAGRRQHYERQVTPVAASEPDEAESWRELRPVLDEEVSHLPERCRAPVLLCYLAGKTNVEAAAELGVSRDMVRRRLEEGAELLRQRLTRRGITLSIAALTAVLTQSAQAAVVPASWLTTLMQNPHGLTQSVVVLAEGVLRDMFVLKCKLAVMAVLVVGVALAAGGAAVQHALTPPPTAVVAAETAPEPPAGEPALQFALGAPVEFAALSPDGKLLAAADHDKKIVVWDRATGKELHQLKVDDRPDPGEEILNQNRSRIPPPVNFAIAADGKTLAAVAGPDLKSGRTLYFFDLVSGKKLHRSHERGDRVAFSADGRTLLQWGPDVTLWETATRQKRTTLANPGGWVNSVALAARGQTLAAVNTHASADGTRGTVVQLWDLASGEKKERLPVAWGQYGGQFAEVICSADGRHVAVAWSKFVAGIDVATGKEMYRVPVNHQGMAWSRLGKMAFTPKSTLLAAAVEDTKATVVNVATGKPVFTETVPGKSLGFVALTPNGRGVLTGNEQGQVRLWPLPAE